MNDSHTRYIFKMISTSTEINKEIHLHQLRHSYATQLLNKVPVVS
ncbi:hypothetical protein WAX74_00040 [Psychrobacillus sp. FJAT-51614]|uniref:Tyr recombinase domain-containing protein n=1 Tax=Psychrobacillus mangrovi TaxID=3117745 RepID=A0ABU8EZ52_9BACI